MLGKFLKKIYPQQRVKEIFLNFPSRSKATIVAKALSLGLPSAKNWQPDEDKILLKHFFESTKGTLQKLLLKRTWASICAHGERLGLKRKNNKPRLGVDEDYF